MASKNFSGTLIEPTGELANNDKIMFAQVTTTGEVIAGSVSIVKIGDDGTYDFDLQYGTISISTYNENSRRWIHQGTVTINSDTLVNTLPGLLNAFTPTTPAIVQQLEQILADGQQIIVDAQAQADSASSSALAAEGFKDLAEQAATASANSANQSALNAVENGNVIKAILIAQGLSGEYGYFADGFTLNDLGDVGIDASYQFWKYTGAETLPYSVPQGTDPSAGNWEIVRLNDHGKLINRNAIGAHDDIYSRLYSDVSSMLASGSFNLGQNAVIKGTLFESLSNLPAVSQIKALTPVNASINGDLTTGDATEKLQDVLNNFRNIVINDDMEINGTVKIPSNTIINFNNVTITVNYTGVESDFNTQTLGALMLEGEETVTSQLLLSQVNEGDYVISTSDASGFTVGDFIVIQQDEITSTSEPESLSRWAVHTADIVDIVGNDIYISQPVNHSYFTTYNASITKVNPCENVFMYGTVNFVFTRPTVTDFFNAIRTSYARNVVLPKSETLFGNGRNLSIRRSHRVALKSSLLKNPTATGSGHGYCCSFIESNDCDVDYVKAVESRHVFDASGGSSNIRINTAIGSSYTQKGNVLNGHGMNNKNITCVKSYALGMSNNIGLGNYTFGGDQDWIVSTMISVGTDSSISLQNFSKSLLVQSLMHKGGKSGEAIKGVQGKDLQIGNLQIKDSDGNSFGLSWDNDSDGLEVGWIKVNGNPGSCIRVARGSKNIKILSGDLSGFTGDASITVDVDPDLTAYDCNLTVDNVEMVGTGYTVFFAGANNADETTTGLKLRKCKITGGASGAIRYRGKEKLILQDCEIYGAVSLSGQTSKLVVTGNYGTFNSISSSGTNVLIANNDNTW